MKTLRIFISSPSDVRSERVRAYDVVQRLQTKFRAFIKIEAILWEDEPMRATASFQAQIPKPSESDVVICVLWAKIGTRLPQDYHRPDGTVPTGTEWEFEDAYASFKARGTPDLLVYRKAAPPQITVTSDEMLVEWQRQKKALDAFLDRWFRDHEGAFQAAFSTFSTDDEFERLLTAHLDKIINRRLETKVPISWTEGSPFRGLDVFELEHQKIFFGRDLAIAEITGRLLEQSRRGRVFLTVLGMSGCGKSSLIRAGVLPELTRPGVVKEVGCWRWAILRPSEAGGTLLDGLASALSGEKTALPELGQLGYNVQRLAGCLRDAPTHAVPLVEAALTTAARRFAQDSLRSTPPEARFILVIDPLEEVFTSERFDAAQRVAFIRALSALSRSGLVWVITTMRSDLYAYCAEIEEFRALKADDGQYDLSPPNVSEVGQIIRMPALAGGLEFETHPDTHQKLDDALQEEASRNPEALPLLEFCLDELYKLQTKDHVITWEAYAKLGGLKGAVAKRAEDVFGGLSPAGRDAFPQVLTALVTMEATATRRLARRKDLVVNPGAEELVAAFAKANLFITDVDQAGEPVVTVAHEALIDSWPRVQEWVQENKDFLRLKTRLAQAAHRWREAGRDNDFLLPEGKPLAEAEDALRRRRRELEDVEFIQASARHAARRRRRRRLLAAGVVTLILAVIFGSVLKQRNDALKAQAEAQRTASKTDFTFAADEMARNEIPVSLAYLADALRNNPANEGAIALCIAELRDSPLPLISLLHGDEVQDASFSRDGTRVVTASVDGTARVWDVATGKPVGEPMKHAGWIHTAEFSPDGTRVVTASWDGTARLWDAQTGREIGSPMQHSGRVVTARFSRDGKWVVTASYDKTAQVWDAQTGTPVGQPMAHKDIVWSARFSPDGTRVVTASADKTARVWDARTGTALSGPLQHQKKEEINLADFSPDGRWIATGSDDNKAQIWDAQTFQRAGQEMPHGGAVNFVSFSEDSRFLATASSDNNAYVWEVPSGRQVGKAMPHAGWVRAARFSPNGRWIVTSSYDRTARVWDARTGLPLSAPMRHSGAVYIASFSPDNSLVATASFDHTARIWAWHEIRSLPAITRPGPMRPADFNADGRWIATASAESAQIWEAGTGRSAGALVSPGDTLLEVRLSADGRRLLTATSRAAQVWDAKTGAPVSPPMLPADPTDPMLGASFSPDGDLVMTVAAGGVGLWDARTGQRRDYAIRPEGRVVNARFNPDGGVIATFTYEGTVNLWNARTGAPIGKPMQHNGPISNVHFSSNGRWLATASMDHTARTWDAQTGEAVGTMWHDSWVRDAEFSPNGQWLVTACTNATAQVWEVRTGLPVSQLMRHKGAVVAASFSPDGQWVVTASADKSAQVWEARTGVAVSTPLAHDGPVVSASFSPNGQWILTAAEDGTARIWEAPFVTREAPAWLIALAEDVGGLSLDAHGVLQPTPRNAAGLRDQLRRLPGTDDVARFGRWFVADPEARPLSPRGD